MDELQGKQHSVVTYEKENMKVTYEILFSTSNADNLFSSLENDLTYYSGQLAKINIFGKWIDIPRQHVAYGETGLKYKFSGNTIPAIPWNNVDCLQTIKQAVESVVGTTFNFVLINRYADGTQYIGEHRDDEKELDADAPIASLSLGQERDFVFRHKDNKGKQCRNDLENIKILLEHGSLLVMYPPTNKFWYHALPKRQRAKQTRINLTFRKMKF